MNSEQLISLTSTAKKAALDAGKAILEIYQDPKFSIEDKVDGSPLTAADDAAHQLISSILSETGLPVLSEEGKSIPYETRKDWDYFWMVDPLDGTKEFIRKNGEFTVNIALIHQNVSVSGVLYAPVLDWMYWGNKAQGAWKQEGSNLPFKLNALLKEGAPNVIVASRSHLSEETQAFLDNYPEANVINMGSSLKFMLVAEGKACYYPRFAPTMEWDTAAAQAILEAAGGKVLAYPNNERMRYNRENMLNGWFLAKGCF